MSSSSYFNFFYSFQIRLKLINEALVSKIFQTDVDSLKGIELQKKRIFKSHYVFQESMIFKLHILMTESNEITASVSLENTYINSYSAH